MATPQPFDPSALERFAAALGWKAPAFDLLSGIRRGSADARRQPLAVIENPPAGTEILPRRLVVSMESTLADSGIHAWTDQLNSVAMSCRQRIRELDDFARGEGSRVNPASEDTFWHFLLRNPFGAEPGLVLLNSGNLRAIWGDMRPTHVGLQFLPDNQIQYVVFARSPSSPRVMRGRGRAEIANIPKLLDSYGVADVLDP